MCLPLLMQGVFTLHSCLPEASGPEAIVSQRQGSKRAGSKSARAGFFQQIVGSIFWNSINIAVVSTKIQIIEIIGIISRDSFAIHFLNKLTYGHLYEECETGRSATCNCSVHLEPFLVITNNRRDPNEGLILCDHV